MVLLRKLEAMAEHPNTPEGERQNAESLAKRIIVEMEEHRRAVARERRSMPTASARMAGLSSRHERPRFCTEWPFGWTGPRVAVEYEMGMLVDGTVVLGWKCPSCGSQIERSMSPREVRRGTPRGEQQIHEYMSLLMNGSTNQLCGPCWERWNNA